MKSIFLKVCICTLAVGVIFCSVKKPHKSVYGVGNKNTIGDHKDTSAEAAFDITAGKNEDNNIQLNNLDNFYISEEMYAEGMKDIVVPYVESRKESGYIDGIGDVKLYYEAYKAEDSKGSIVISHGYTENLEKYKEMTYYFLNSGYNVFGIEHRGHGRSGSLGIADISQIYVNSFNDYIEDFKSFLDEIVVPNSNGQDLMLFAHSMGGAIGSRFLEVYPQYFSKAVLNAPMMEVHTGNIPDFIAKVIVNAAVTFGQGGKYVIGKEPFTPCYSFNSTGTSSENRWTYVNEIINSDKELQRGGASYKWTQESFKATKEITKKENASKVEIPVLLFQAGDDAYVKPKGQNKFAEYAKNCNLVRIENSKHEIYFERDEIQKPYIEQVLNFYNQ